MSKNRTPFTWETEDDLCEQIECWHEEEEYSRCIAAIEKIPDDECGYRLIHLLARAYQNYVLFGERGSGTLDDEEESRACMQRALDLLDAVWDDGIDRAEWNQCMLYSCAYLDKYDLAARYAKRWLKLAPDDEEAAEAVEIWGQGSDGDGFSDDGQADDGYADNDEDDDYKDEAGDDDEYSDDEDDADDEDDDYGDEDDDYGDEGDADNETIFCGYVLLERAELDLKRFLKAIKDLWGFNEANLRIRQDNVFTVTLDDIVALVALKDEPIPGGEAERGAQFNYLWPDGPDAVERHRASICVLISEGPGKKLRASLLLIKLLFTFCGIQDVIGIYTNGVVYEPDFFIRHGNDLYRHKLPVPIMIWIGLLRFGQRCNMYTLGLSFFDRDEIEILNSNADPDDLRRFLIQLANDVLENRITLSDGGYVESEDGDLHRVTYGPSSLRDGMSYKIEFE